MAAILGSQAAIAVENALLFDESVRRATELSSLLEAAQVASSTIDLEEMVRLIARQMVNVLGVDGCVLSRWDRSANTVVTWVEWLDNNTDYPDEPGTSYSLDEYESTRRVLENSEPVVVQANDPEAEPTEVAWMRKQGILSSLMLPLGSGDKAIGLVELIETKVERNFTPGEIQLCQAMASQAAMTIENARLFEGTRLQLQRLAALREIDTAITASMDRHLTLNILLEQVVNTLQVDAAEILLLSSHSQMLKAACQRGHPGLRLSRSEFRLGEGLAGQAALERRTLAFPDLRRPAGAEAEQLLRSGCGAYFAVPLVAKAQVKGVLEVFHRSPLYPDPDWLAFLETLAGQAAIAIDNAALFDDLQRSNTELTLAYDATLEGWARALDLRDKETEGHTRRVTEMTLRLAQAMGVPDAELLHVRRGALLHDIGKMGIPDSILLKPGPLTEAEWEIMRRHPVYAYEMLSPIAYLRPALDIPYAHHEKWDGSGYPRRLAGEQIPLPARIFAVADVWDALLSDRPYRPAWSEDAALEYIRGQAGRHFDPRVVELFLTLVEVVQFELVS